MNHIAVGCGVSGKMKIRCGWTLEKSLEQPGVFPSLTPGQLSNREREVTKNLMDVHAKVLCKESYTWIVCSRHPPHMILQVEAKQFSLLENFMSLNVLLKAFRGGTLYGHSEAWLTFGTNMHLRWAVHKWAALSMLVHIRD